MPTRGPGSEAIAGALFRAAGTTDPSREGWPQWFSKIGDALVDLGSPMANGFVLHTDRSTREDATAFNGYSVVQASDRREVIDLLCDHPYLALGGEHTIEDVCHRGLLR